MLEGLISRSPFMSAKQCGMLSLLMVAGFACSDDDTNSAVSSAGGASGAAGSGGLATLEAGLRSEGAAGSGGTASQAEGGDTAGGTFSTLRVQRTNLVSDEADAGAVHVDPNVVNAWGLAFGPTGLAWISDNGTGKASVYAADGTMQSLVVTIPTPGDAGEASAPTGMVFNPSSDFKGDKFIMVTEEGTVAGWQDGTTAVIRVDASASEAIYKGAALVTQANVETLAAANFHNGTVDIYDKTYQPVAATTAFTDTTIPAGFAPFNVVSIDNDVYVTYAKQDADKEDDVAGVGNGYVNQFDVTGQFVRRLVSTGTLNSPWAVVRAPASFGALANTLLIGNFGDGKVYAYDPTTGVARGQLVDAANAELRLDGLWALVFGPARGADGGVAAASDAGTSPRLFFTAGPDEEKHGIFGYLDPIP